MTHGGTAMSVWALLSLSTRVGRDWPTQPHRMPAIRESGDPVYVLQHPALVARPRGVARPGPVPTEVGAMMDTSDVRVVTLRRCCIRGMVYPAGVELTIAAWKASELLLSGYVGLVNPSDWARLVVRDECE